MHNNLVLLHLLGPIGNAIVENSCAALLPRRSLWLMLLLTMQLLLILFAVWYLGATIFDSIWRIWRVFRILLHQERRISNEIFPKSHLIVLLLNELHLLLLGMLADVGFLTTRFSTTRGVFDWVWGGKKVTPNLRKHWHCMGSQRESRQLCIRQILRSYGIRLVLLVWSIWIIVGRLVWRFGFLDRVLKQISLVFSHFGSFCRQIDKTVSIDASDTFVFSTTLTPDHTPSLLTDACIITFRGSLFCAIYNSTLLGWWRNCLLTILANRPLLFDFSCSARSKHRFGINWNVLTICGSLPLLTFPRSNRLLRLLLIKIWIWIANFCQISLAHLVMFASLLRSILRQRSLRLVLSRFEVQLLLITATRPPQTTSLVYQDRIGFVCGSLWNRIRNWSILVAAWTLLFHPMILIQIWRISNSVVALILAANTGRNRVGRSIARRVLPDRERGLSHAQIAPLGRLIIMLVNLFGLLIVRRDKFEDGKSTVGTFTSPRHYGIVYLGDQLFEVPRFVVRFQAVLLELGVISLANPTFWGSARRVKHFSDSLTQNWVSFGSPGFFGQIWGKQMVNCHIFGPLHKEDLLFAFALKRLLNWFPQVGAESVPDCVLIRRVHVLVWRSLLHRVKVDLHKLILELV